MCLQSHISQLRNQPPKEGDQQGWRRRGTSRVSSWGWLGSEYLMCLKENSSMKTITVYDEYKPILQKVSVKAKKVPLYRVAERRPI